MKKMLHRIIPVIVFQNFFTATYTQVNNWIGAVHINYLNKHNRSFTTLNFAGVNTWRMRIVAGARDARILNGGNISNVNYRSHRLNKLGVVSFICNGAVYSCNKDFFTWHTRQQAGY